MVSSAELLRHVEFLKKCKPNNLHNLCCTSADIFKFLMHLEEIYSKVEMTIIDKLFEIVETSKCSIQHDENT